MKIVVDAYAWIEIFLGSEKGVKAKEALEKASEVYTPDTVLAEIARKYLREGISLEEIVERLKIVTEVSNILSIDLDIALEAAKSYIELSKEARREGLRNPSLFDAIVLSAARTVKAKVLTGDKHFRSRPETIWIG